MMGSLYQLNPHCFLSLSPSLVWQQIPAPLSFAPQLLSQQRLAALLSTQSLSPHLAPWVNSHPSQERSSPRARGKHFTSPALPQTPHQTPRLTFRSTKFTRQARYEYHKCNDEAGPLLLSWIPEETQPVQKTHRFSPLLLCSCAPWSLSCPPCCSEQGVPVDNVVQVHCNNEPGFLCITGTTGALVLKNVHPVGNFQEEERKLLKEIEFICYLHNYITQNRIWWYFVEGSGEKGEGIL